MQTKRTKMRKVPLPLYVPLIHILKEDDGLTAHLPVVFDHWKAQPAAATKAARLDTLQHFTALH